MKKLDHKRLGPFTVLDVVSTHARRLELPPSLNAIHNVFHVSLLEPHHPNPYPTRTTPPPPTIEVDGDIEYEVEEILNTILDRRTKKLYYLVKWLGYDEVTKEPESNLTHAPDLVAAFHRRYPSKPGPHNLAALLNVHSRTTRNRTRTAL